MLRGKWLGGQGMRLIGWGDISKKTQQCHLSGHRDGQLSDPKRSIINDRTRCPLTKYKGGPLNQSAYANASSRRLHRRCR
jgi:hypothetical protein